MAYLAIARKFRPQRFEDVVGQGHVTRTLQNAITLGRIHHAFLFTGARGVGKTTAARILAKSLNCVTGPTVTPCNECQICKEITSGIANDVLEIDAASNTGVENIRDLRDNLRYLPSSGRYKIYIIDEVHMLSTAAFNALLKTLEEPPPHVIFIFATTDPQKVPDTILSRCQRFDFKRIPLKQISDKLADIARREDVQISEASLLMIAREAEGSMRDAQSLLDQVLSATSGTATDDQVVEILGLIDRRQIYDCVEGLLQHDPDRSMAVVEAVYHFGFDLKQLARELLEVIRNLNVVKVSEQADRFVDVSAEELAHLRALAANTAQDVLSRLFALLLEGYDQIARSEAPRFSLEMTLLRLSQVRPAQPVDTLLERLAGLEGLVRSGALRAAASGSGGNPAGGNPAGGNPAGGNPAGGSSPSRLGGAGSSIAGPASPGTGPRTGGASGFSARVDALRTLAGARSREDAGAPGASPDARGSFQASQTASGASQGGFRPGMESVEPDSDDDEEPASDVVSGQATASGLASSSPPPPGSRSWIGFVEDWLGRGETLVRPNFALHASPIAEELERIVLGVRNPMQLGKVQQELAPPEIDTLLRQYFGRSTRIECTLLQAGQSAPESFREREERRESERREQIRQQELSHPLVRLAVTLFGVSPQTIRTELEPAPGRAG